MMKELTSADGHKLDCWIENAQGQVKGGLVILQEIFGITDQLKGVAQHYAKLGYTVAIPALFDRHGKGHVVPFENGPVGRDMMLASDLDQTMLDVKAAVDDLSSSGLKVAVMGFCWGGGLAIHAAQILDINCAIAFYGTRLPQYLEHKLKVPAQGHFGINDDHVPAEMLAQAKEHMPELEVHMYETGHAFANDARPAAYDEPSAKLAHKRAQDFMAANL